MDLLTAQQTFKRDRPLDWLMSSNCSRVSKEEASDKIRKQWQDKTWKQMLNELELRNWELRDFKQSA